MAAEAPTTGFVYQGQVKLQGVPVRGELDFLFTLWDVVEGGREVARGVELGRVPVIDGLFEVTLDFGLEPFNGAPRWLEITVTDRGSDARATLRPRQPLTPTPVALYAITGSEGPQGPPGPPGEGVLTLPYAGAVASNVVGFSVLQSGLASAGAFVIDNTNNNQPAVSLITVGSGPGLLSMTGVGGGAAGAFLTQGVSNTQSALLATNNASGHAGQFVATRDGSHMAALSAENNGSGSAGEFITGWDPDPDPDNGNTAPTVTATNDAWGSAGWLNITNAQNDADVFWASGNGRGTSVLGSTTGLGAAGRFVVSNTSNSSSSLAGETNGSGKAVSGVTTGTGNAGYFQTNNTGNSRNTLQVVGNGRASAGFFQTTNAANAAAALAVETVGNNNAFYAEARGAGDAVLGHNAFGGDGVVGIVEGVTGHAGSFSIAEATNRDAALLASTTGAGPAAHIESTGNSLALDVVGNGVSKEALRVENNNADRGRGAFFRNESSEPTMTIVNAGFGPIMELANSTAQVVMRMGQGGQVWARRFEFSQPKTHRMSFGSADFENGEVDVNYGTRFICVSTDVSSMYRVYAPVHLPDGATINSVDFIARDVNGSEDLTMILGRTAFNGDDAVGLARLDTVGSGGVQRRSTPAILYETIDNDNYSYYLSVHPTYIICDARCCWPNGMAVLGAVIEYTTTEAD